MSSSAFGDYQHGAFFEEAEKEDAFKKFKQAIHAVHNQVQSPIEMAFVSALHVAATCVQGSFDVMCPGSGRSPVSLNILVSAESGERKTATDKKFSQCLSDFEKKQNQQINNNLASFKAAKEVWRQENKNIKKLIEKAQRDDNQDAIPGLQEKLEKNIKTEPATPVDFRILYEDSTLPALLQKLATTSKSASLSSSEGGIILNKLTIDFFLNLNKLWDGDEVHVDRVNRPSFIVSDARLSVAMMVQKELLKRHLKQREDKARASGFLARCLIIEPKSRQGLRTQSTTPEQQTMNNRYIRWFHDRASQLLNESFNKGEGARQEIYFTPESAEIWRKFHHSIEMHLIHDGDLSSIRDFASKISNNMSRIAAVLHVFCGRKGEIDADIAKFSVDACILFIEEFKRICTPENSVEAAWKNAKKFYDFLKKECAFNPFKRIEKRTLQQYGPFPCRSLDKFEAALAILKEKNLVHIQVSSHGGLNYEVGLNNIQASLPSFHPMISIPNLGWAILLQTHPATNDPLKYEGHQ